MHRLKTEKIIMLTFFKQFISVFKKEIHNISRIIISIGKHHQTKTENNLNQKSANSNQKTSEQILS